MSEGLDENRVLTMGNSQASSEDMRSISSSSSSSSVASPLLDPFSPGRGRGFYNEYGYEASSCRRVILGVIPVTSQMNLRKLRMLLSQEDQRTMRASPSLYSA